MQDTVHLYMAFIWQKVGAFLVWILSLAIFNIPGLPGTKN